MGVLDDPKLGHAINLNTELSKFQNQYFFAVQYLNSKSQVVGQVIFAPWLNSENLVNRFVVNCHCNDKIVVLQLSVLVILWTKFCPLINLIFNFNPRPAFWWKLKNIFFC